MAQKTAVHPVSPDGFWKRGDARGGAGHGPRHGARHGDGPIRVRHGLAARSDMSRLGQNPTPPPSLPFKMNQTQGVTQKRGIWVLTTPKSVTLELTAWLYSFSAWLLLFGWRFLWLAGDSFSGWFQLPSVRWTGVTFPKG